MPVKRAFRARVRDKSKKSPRKGGKTSLKPKFVPGYHLKPIKKGLLGDLSKIIEEVEELKDAELQG